MFTFSKTKHYIDNLILFRSENIHKGTRYQVALLFHPIYFFFVQYKPASWFANQEISYFEWTRRFISIYTQNPQLDPIWSQFSVRTLYHPISVIFNSKLFFHLGEVYLLSFIRKVVSPHIPQVCNLLCLHRGSLKSQDVKYV